MYIARPWILWSKEWAIQNIFKNFDELLIYTLLNHWKLIKLLIKLINKSWKSINNIIGNKLRSGVNQNHNILYATTDIGLCMHLFVGATEQCFHCASKAF